MAHYNGAVDIDISSYDAWRSATLNNSYDMDGFYGCQCWDYCAEFWYNTRHYVYPYLQTGPLGYAYECWTVSRAINAADQFELVTNLSDVKRGDVVVFNPLAGWIGSTGHIAFADEDYNGSGYLNILGQNQSGHQYVDIFREKTDSFLGAFRYKGWIGPTPPPHTPRKKKFPWYIYHNRRNSGIM